MLCTPSATPTSAVMSYWPAENGSDAEGHHARERFVGVVIVTPLGSHLDVDLGHLGARVVDDHALAHCGHAPAVGEEPDGRGAGRRDPGREPRRASLPSNVWICPSTTRPDRAVIVPATAVRRRTCSVTSTTLIEFASHDETLERLRRERPLVRGELHVDDRIVGIRVVEEVVEPRVAGRHTVGDVPSRRRRRRARARVADLAAAPRSARPRLRRLRCRPGRRRRRRARPRRG